MESVNTGGRKQNKNKKDDLVISHLFLLQINSGGSLLPRIAIWYIMNKEKEKIWKKAEDAIPNDRNAAIYLS